MYSHRDEGAEPVRPSGGYGYGISDLFLVIPRELAGDFVSEIGKMYESAKDQRERSHISCGERMSTVRLCDVRCAAAECLVKCAMARLNIPVAMQNFQLRLVRPHVLGGCPPGRGNHYNSLCI